VDVKALVGEVDVRSSSPTEGLSEEAARASRSMWAKACRWWDAHGIQRPVTEQDVLRFLVVHEGCGVRHLGAIKRSISRHHDHEHDVDPCGRGVERFLRAYERVFGEPVRPADAMTPSEFNLLVATAPSVLGPYEAARFILLLTVAYGAWLRGVEAVNLRLSDFRTNGDAWRVFVVRSKSDKKREGVLVTLALPPGCQMTLERAVRGYKAAADAADLDVNLESHIAVSLRTGAPIQRKRFAQEIEEVAAAAGIAMALIVRSRRSRSCSSVTAGSASTSKPR